CSSPTDSQLLADHRPPTTLYPLSLHDALPILNARAISNVVRMSPAASGWRAIPSMARAVAKAWLIADPSAGSAIVSATAQNAIKDRKSTRLNSSHVKISYAVFCLKKKKTTPKT